MRPVRSMIWKFRAFLMLALALCVLAAPVFGTICIKKSPHEVVVMTGNLSATWKLFDNLFGGQGA
jgi:hypothetical protein